MKSKVILHLIYSGAITLAVEALLIFGLETAAEQFAGTRMALLLFVLSGIIIFAIVFWLFEKRSYDYIDKITSAVKNISSGDLTTTLEIEGDNEFSEIAMNLNSMTKDIKVLMEKERESEKSKNELITNVAHDLRTPLTSIIGYLELLSIKKDLPEETRNQYTNIAYTKSKRLYKLIEDLFGFTKLNYGKIAMNIEQVDIVKLLSQLMDEFYPNFTEKNLKWDLRSNVDSCIISADGNLLARLFDNLINNAIKYGADGKRIDVIINAAEENVDVSVVNFGKVIPAEELPYVFDKFYRVEQSRNKNTGGTGLGLAIAKNIVDMHNGQIRVESDLKGTRFIVTLKVHFDVDKEHF